MRVCANIRVVLFKKYASILNISKKCLQRCTLSQLTVMHMLRQTLCGRIT